MEILDKEVQRFDERFYRKAIHRVRAIIFINTLIVSVGIKRHPAVLTRWGHHFEKQDIDPVCNDLSVKWRRFLRGVLVGTYLRVKLCKRFVRLFFVMINPLWVVLFHLELFTHKFAALVRLGSGARERRALARRYRDKRETLVATIRIGDQDLSKASLKSLSQVLFVGGWQRLAFSLAIIASRSLRWEAHRTWLHRRFSVIFLLACLHPEMTGATRLLYQVIDHLIRQGMLCPPRAWPKSLHEFTRRLSNLRRLVRKLQRQRGMTEQDALRMVRDFFNDLSNKTPLFTDLDVCSAGIPVNVCSPELAPLFERCYRQRRWKYEPCCEFRGLKLDPKALQGWTISKI